MNNFIICLIVAILVSLAINQHNQGKIQQELLKQINDLKNTVDVSNQSLVYVYQKFFEDIYSVLYQEILPEIKDMKLAVEDSEQKLFNLKSEIDALFKTQTTDFAKMLRLIEASMVTHMAEIKGDA